MKTTINFEQFQQAFIDANRAYNFTEEGLKVLFNFLEALEEDTGEEIELDVLALCCEFEEATEDAIKECYGLDGYVLGYLEYHTMVVGTTDNTIIYAEFQTKTTKGGTVMTNIIERLNFSTQPSDEAIKVTNNYSLGFVRINREYLI